MVATKLGKKVQVFKSSGTIAEDSTKDSIAGLSFRLWSIIDFKGDKSIIGSPFRKVTRAGIYETLGPKICLPLTIPNLQRAGKFDGICSKR